MGLAVTVLYFGPEIDKTLDILTVLLQALAQQPLGPGHLFRCNYMFYKFCVPVLPVGNVGVKKAWMDASDY